MRFQNALSYTSYHGRPAEGRRGSDMGAPASPATVVESIDDEESDRWKAMADAFDFGGLSDDDDDDGTSGDDRGGTRNDYTRRGDDDAEAPSTSQRRGRTAGASRLLPVRWLESRCVGSVDAADRGSFPGVEADPSTPAEGAAADKIDAGAEANEELAARFAGEYRSTQPFLTRRVAETWMTRSALGRRGARGALEAYDPKTSAQRLLASVHTALAQTAVLQLITVARTERCSIAARRFNAVDAQSFEARCISAINFCDARQRQAGKCAARY